MHGGSSEDELVRRGGKDGWVGMEVLVGILTLAKLIPWDWTVKVKWFHSSVFASSAIYFLLLLLIFLFPFFSFCWILYLSSFVIKHFILKRQKIYKKGSKVLTIDGIWLKTTGNFIHSVWRRRWWNWKKKDKRNEFLRFLEFFLIFYKSEAKFEICS